MNRKKLAFWPLRRVFIVFALVTLTLTVIKSCPLVCTCKWKGGKRKVECSNKNITSLLSNIESETQVLDYSRNRLPTLHERIFEKMNLINLQKLYLSECQIAAIHRSAFHGLSNLIEIDLASNALSSVPSTTFKDFPLLMKLTIAGNPIKELKSYTFAILKHLASLDLGDCQIEVIEKNAFSGLEKLEWLKLERNKLKNFKFVDTLPQLTGGLSLHRNPWRCDCHLRPFRSWLSNVRRIPITDEPVCVEPPIHKGIAIVQLRANDLACPPGVVPSSLFVEINEGKNISFVCQVNAVPEARITWDFEGNPVSGNSSFVYPFYRYYAEDATTDQVSELFVYRATKENNGTYRCTAENVAGRSSSNYTLKVIGTGSGTPQAAAVSHLQVIVTSVSVVLSVALTTLLFVSCSIYFYRKPSTASRSRRKPDDVDYEIVKQRRLVVARKASPLPKTEWNPDLITNTERKLENCEHVLVIPHDPKRTYITVAGNAVVNATTTMYDGTTVVADSDANSIPSLTAVAPAGILNLYLSPGGVRQNFQNVYVNPLDGYVNSIEPNCWTSHQRHQLSKEELCNSGKERADYGNQAVCGGEKSESYGEDDDDGTCNDVVNLRHNLEGYPFPSKLNVRTDEANLIEEIDNMPILSPPDPFKTDINQIDVEIEKFNK